MIIGRKFKAKFVDDASRSAYFTFSAAQMLVYNASVEEARYFESFDRKFISSVPRPDIDQKYSHLIDFAVVPWVKSVPSGVYGVGAYLHYQAHKRFQKGLTSKPRVHPIKNADRHLLLTKSYFSIRKLKGQWYELTFGSKSKPGGRVLFKAHQSFEMPVTVYVTCRQRALTVSFNFDDGQYPESDQEMADRLAMMGYEELLDKTLGFDRGVARKIQSSCGEHYELLDIQQERIKRKQRSRKHYQRILARRQKGSQNSRKMRRRVARSFQYESNVRQDFAHQVSHQLASQPGIELFVFEDLNIKGMTAKPKAKYDANGKPLRNGAKAKAGLAKGILSSAWAKTQTYLKYKARCRHKLVIEVPSAYTSQKCSHCGCTAKENRLSQSVFRCTRCQMTMNADENAALNIRQAGAWMVSQGQWSEKKVKRLLRVKSAKPTAHSVTTK